MFAYNYPPSQYVSLIYGFFAVFTRAIVVPSTGPRTLVIALADVRADRRRRDRCSAIFSCDDQRPAACSRSARSLLSAIAVLLATIGSHIIYGLRRQVSAAMQLGQYTLDRKIGEGGMGAVYRAHHAMLRRPTAIKLLLPDRVGAREPRALRARGAAHEPAHAPEHRRGLRLRPQPRRRLLLRDGVPRRRSTSRTSSARFGPQPSDRVAQILAQVCGALGEAHDRGIIHRDIKPANIILCERGGMPDVAKVVDFGLVKEITGDGGKSQQVILGTPAYIAPEAVTDPDRVGPACDLYALGAVGYFLLTGRRVFDGKTAVDVCIQHVTDAPKPPSSISAVHIPPELEAILMKCLQKNPSRPVRERDRDGRGAPGAPSRPRTGISARRATWWAQPARPSRRPSVADELAIHAVDHSGSRRTPMITSVRNA